VACVHVASLASSWPLLMHASLNVGHFALFTYPYLQRA